VSRLLEKYGWVVGQHDCENVLPLDKWAPGDRGMLKALYKPKPEIVLSGGKFKPKRDAKGAQLVRSRCRKSLFFVA
jgi:hypothetical protein